MDSRHIVSISPHIRDPESAAKVMRTVLLSLAPAVIASVYIFGWRVLLVSAVSIAVSMAAEALSQLAFKRPITVSDGSAMVTGLLMAFTLPVQTPLWMVVIGAITAVFLVKQLFGGLGYNIFNPALAARAVLLSSFPVAMTAWSAPVLSLAAVDAVSAASALGVVKEAARAAAEGAAAGAAAAAQAMPAPHSYLQLLIGSVPGSLGETSKIALLAGAAFLLLRRIIDWRVPVTFIGSVALLSFIVGRDPLFEVLAGGLILGAFFMATDYVTAPTTGNGRIIFGLGCGIITFLIRLYGGFPEGVCYAILFMNCVSPLIELYVQPRRFGSRTARRAGAAGATGIHRGAAR